ARWRLQTTATNNPVVATIGLREAVIGAPHSKSDVLNAQAFERVRSAARLRTRRTTGLEDRGGRRPLRLANVKLLVNVPVRSLVGIHPAGGLFRLYRQRPPLTLDA